MTKKLAAEIPFVSPEYGSMNNGPHVGTWIRTYAPCVTAQLGFWHIPDTEPEEMNIRMFDVFQAFCSALQDTLTTYDAPFNDVTIANAKPDSIIVRAWRFQAKMPGFGQVHMLLDAHTEYWRLFFLFEIGPEPIGSSNAAPRTSFPFNLAEAVHFRCGGDLRAIFVHQFAKFLSDVVSLATLSSNVAKERCRDMFALFFGSVMDVKEGSTYSESIETGEQRPAKIDGTQSGEAKRWEKHRRIQNERGLLRAYFQEIKSLQGIVNNARGVELTASTFCDGRAMYVSSLGHPKSRRLPTDTIFSNLVPVVFTLFSTIDDRWQLGRLIDTINLMGVIRLASLREIGEISKTAASIREIRKQIAGSKASVKSLRQSILKLLSTDISSKIERSNRYAKQFEERIAYLRAKRIEGFQPYDLFVKRRVGDTLTFIQSTGRQLSLLRKEIDLRCQYDQTESVLSLQLTAELLSVIPIAYYISGLLPKDALKTISGMIPTICIGPISISGAHLAGMYGFLASLLLGYFAVHACKLLARRAMRKSLSPESAPP